jgi:hypothetical protein
LYPFGPPAGGQGRSFFGGLMGQRSNVPLSGDD